MSNSELEDLFAQQLDLFAQQLDALGLTGYLREYPAVKGRKFRWDFCYECARLLIEVNGSTFTKADTRLARG